MDINIVFVLLAGLIFGSFLNVCIYRLPRGESIVFPGSHCPHCGAALRALDNIPILSFLFLRGRCRSCRNRISLQYPTVELLNCAAFLLCYFKWGLLPPAFLNAALASAVIVLIFIDYHHQILPNVITLPGILAGIALCTLQTPAFFRDLLVYKLAALIHQPDPSLVLPWVGSILGALLGGGILLLVGSAYQMARKKQGLGMGDVKMMAMVGAFMGWRLTLFVIFAGSALGSLIGLFLILFKGQTLQTKLAFGTFLGAATLITLFFGIDILHWYSSLL